MNNSNENYIQVEIQKTIQEIPYEPYSLKITVNKGITDNIEKDMYELTSKIETFIDNKIQERINNRESFNPCELSPVQFEVKNTTIPNDSKSIPNESVTIESYNTQIEKPEPKTPAKINSDFIFEV